MNSRAIEGLKISVQCSNVVLSWPSVETETYIVQYRPTLNPDPGIPWQMLTNFMPAEFGTNVTVFVHSNIVLNPNCGGSGSSMMMSPGSSKPATCGRFKTSHPEVVEFISVLVVASSAFASRPASNRQSRDQPGLVAAGLCQRLAAASDFIPSRLYRLRPTAGSTSCSCCFAPPSMSL